MQEVFLTLISSWLVIVVGNFTKSFGPRERKDSLKYYFQEKHYILQLNSLKSLPCVGISAPLLN